MRQSDRYNPPWERYTRADYREIAEIVKQIMQNGIFITSVRCKKDTFLRIIYI